VGAPIKAQVCGRSTFGIAVSNPTWGMDVFLQKFVRRADHSSRGVLPNVYVRE